MKFETIKSYNGTVIFILSFVWAFNFFACGNVVFSCHKYLEEEIRPMNINGEVASIDSNSPCFYQLQIKGENGNIHKITICHCRGNEKIKKHVQLGNEIIKKEGSLEVLVRGKFGAFRFDFPCCDG